MNTSTWRSPSGDLDVLSGLASSHGEVSYEDLVERAHTFEVDDQEVLVADLDDVIEAKRTANRPKDHEVLPELEEISAERRRATDPLPTVTPTRLDTPTNWPQPAPGTDPGFPDAPSRGPGPTLAT